MKKTYKYIILILSGMAIVVLSLSLGSTFISPSDIFDALMGSGHLNEQKIILSLRIPRLIMAVIVGASLAVSGVIFQSILKNPLASPYTLGIASAANLGACIGIILFAGTVFITLGALAGGVGISFIIYLLSIRKRFSSISLILSGVAFHFMLSSIVLVIFSLSPANQAHKAIMWMMGDLSVAHYTMLWKAAPFCIIVILLSYIYYRHLNVISLGNEFAHTLGVTKRDVQNLFWIASILAAVSVSLAGTIGFVGLIVPHVARNLFGPDHRRLIPLSAVMGSLFLVLCDTVGRSIVPPYELPIGAITGSFGGIFFLIMMIRRGDRV
ncbi:FecCD family ABC transporter permease [Spirochaetota bacterium]